MFRFVLSNADLYTSHLSPMDQLYVVHAAFILSHLIDLWHMVSTVFLYVHLLSISTLCAARLSLFIKSLIYLLETLGVVEVLPLSVACGVHNKATNVQLPLNACDAVR